MMEEVSRYRFINSLWRGLRFISIVLALSMVNHASFAATTQHANPNKTKTEHRQNESVALHKKKKKYQASKKHKTKHLAKRYPTPHANIPNIQNVKPELTETQSVTPRRSFVANIEDKLISFVHKTVSHLRYSAYKLGGSKFDTTKGIYVVDCSNYVDRILETIYPKAYSSLVNWTGTDNPTTYDYYNFFTELPNYPKYNWTKVEDVEELRTGDILVFRYKNSSGNETGGHVMIVMDKPTVEDDNFLVRVADSASGGHSEDTRQRHVSGVGIGTLVLKKDPKTFQPSAFAWSFGSHWKRNVNFAMLRPIEFS